MKILYIDCPAGISGDMFLGALIDSGVEADFVKSALGALKLDGYTITTEKKKSASITGTSFTVEVTEDQSHRSYATIRAMIDESELSGSVKALAQKIFLILAEAEGKVHGVEPDDVHFHEVGAIDSIVDIVGAAIAVDSLGVEEVHCSELSLGSGFVGTEHGTMAVPTPATLDIVRGVPVTAGPAEAELTTPTGASIAVSIADHFGTMPDMVVREVGYGVGSRDLGNIANVTRVAIGESAAACGEGKGGEPSKVTVVETNIDDMSPEICGYLMETLFEDGALDVYFTPVQMKKGRPGVLLTVLCGAERRAAITERILTESTSIGVRYYEAKRACLEREIIEIDTIYGAVRVKVSTKDGVEVNRQPEYEDLKRVAREKGVPIKSVIEEVTAALKG